MFKSKAVLFLLSALALVFVGGFIFMSSNNTGSKAVADTASSAAVVDTTATPVTTTPTDNTATVPVQTTPVTTAPAQPAATTKQYAYKDGTYTAKGSYQTPESTETISVTLTIKNDVVVDASVSTQAQARESSRYQSMFAANFKQYVIGKDISTLSLSHVSGSSLTSGGFNAAVAQIKTQAKA